MVSSMKCLGCAYLSHDGYGDLGWYCSYLIVTGLSRLAQMTPEDRASGRCPVRTEKPVRRPGPVRPRVHGYDPVVRLKRRGGELADE